MNIIYKDENGVVLETTPNLTKGKIVSSSQEITAHHEATKEISHLENLEGTKGMGVNGDYLHHLVIDIPATEAWDEYSTIEVYHAFTADEQAEYDVGLNTNAEIVALKKALEENTVALAELIGG